MLRAVVSFLYVLVLCAFAVSCGSSSHPNMQCTTGPFNIVGDWKGSFMNNTGSDNLVGVISSSGKATFVDNLADIAVFSSLTGTCSFTNTLSVYGSQQSGTPGSASGAAQGNVASATSFSGSSAVNNTSETFNFTTYPPITTVAAISGNKTGIIQGPATDLLTLTLGGASSNITFSGTDIGTSCAVNGTFAQEGTSNVYDVTYNIVAGGTCTAATVTGLGFESTSDILNANGGAAGTYLYGIIPTASTPFVVEIY